jgi:GAF domain-containing protein
MAAMDARAGAMLDAMSADDPGPRGRLDDPDRLRALDRADLRGPYVREPFDRLAQLTARLLDVPVALVSIVEPDRQVFPGQAGLDEPWATARETPLSHSFCQHVVTSRRMLAIEDAREDPRVADNLAIPDLGVVAYLGVPLISPDGHVLGSLCVIDERPREWTDEDQRLLRDLCRSVTAEIHLRVLLGEAQGSLDRERHMAMQLNDDIVQRLVAAKLQLQLDGISGVAVEHVTDALVAAQVAAGDMLARAGEIGPGSLRRDGPS